MYSSQEYNVFFRRIQCILLKNTMYSSEEYIVFFRRIHCILEKNTLYSSEEYNVFFSRIQCILLKNTMYSCCIFLYSCVLCGPDGGSDLAQGYWYVPGLKSGLGLRPGLAYVGVFEALADLRGVSGRSYYLDGMRPSRVRFRAHPVEAWEHLGACSQEHLGGSRGGPF
jgi:hypothetical protein